VFFWAIIVRPPFHVRPGALIPFQNEEFRVMSFHGHSYVFQLTPLQDANQYMRPFSGRDLVNEIAPTYA
jgi:hypothetical protein